MGIDENPAFNKKKIINPMIKEHQYVSNLKGKSNSYLIIEFFRLIYWAKNKRYIYCYRWKEEKINSAVNNFYWREKI